MKKRRNYIVFAGFIFYLILLRLLVYVESFSPDSSIVTMKDAVWYSFVTLTTVGYGDLYPVTLAGRIIGVVFLLLSTSLIAMLVVLAMTFTQSFKKIRLRTYKNKEWYIFSHLNKESAALAENIIKENNKAVIIFSEEDNSDELTSSLNKSNVIFIKSSIFDILNLRKNNRLSNIFIMSDDGYANYREALQFAQTGCHIFCKSNFQQDYIPENITLFDRYDCCGRLYWQNNPLKTDEKKIVLYGCDNYGYVLLENGLLTNVFSPDQNIEYHIIGDGSDFLNYHAKLSKTVCINEKAEFKDSIFFYSENSKELSDIITSADRIIICSDKDEDNMEFLQKINKYYPVKGQIHTRLSNPIQESFTFGADCEIFTPEIVMRTQLDRIAVAMHEIYLKQTCKNEPQWNQLTTFLRSSNIAAAEHIPVKIRILLCDDSIKEINAELCRKAYSIYLETKEDNSAFYRSVEHARWMRFHYLHNWSYSNIRNNSLRLHPCLMDYNNLTPDEQEKDDYAWELLGELAEIL